MKKSKKVVPMGRSKPYVDLGDRLKQRRKELKMTQMHVATHAKIELRHLQRIESGQVDIRWSSLVKLCAYLKLEVELLTAVEKSYLASKIIEKHLEETVLPTEPILELQS